MNTQFWWGNVLRTAHLGDPRRGWEDNVKIYRREIGSEKRKWTEVAEDRVQ
jgi:hypothetical protein